MAENKQKDKNIILISIDCLRADHLHCMGYPKNITPTMDKLAKKGVLFTNAYSNAPYTNYSVPSFITSRIPPIGKGFKETIATMLKKKGYSTCSLNPNPIILNELLTQGGRIDRGFDKFDLMLNTKKRLNLIIGAIRNWKSKDFRKILDDDGFFYKTIYVLYDKLIKTFPAQLCPKEHLLIPRAEDINKKAIEWINSQKGKFFLWLHYMDVHEPYTPPDYENKNEMLYLATKYRDFPNKLTKEEIKKLENLYSFSIRHVDKEINNLIERLEEMGKLENSVIIITADHGDAFAEHQRALGHGGKFVVQLYEEVVHIPIIVYGYKKNTFSTDKLVQNIDLAPTICEIAGIPSPPVFFGKSLFSSSYNKEIIINSFEKIAYRNQRYKLIFNKKNHDKNKTYELYDLSVDKKEQHNIYKENPELFKKLRNNMFNLLEKYRKKDKMLNVKQYVKK